MKLKSSVELENVMCQLGCHQNDEFLFAGSDRLHNLPGKFSVIKCKTCGLIRTSPRPTLDTIRFTKDGGMIFLCSELNVTDIDCSTISKSGKEIGYFDEEFPEFKIYYGVRNHTYLSKYFIENKLFFYGNMCVVLLLYLKKLRKTPKKIFIKRYKLVLRAINDGLNNRLGKIFDI